MSKCRYIRGDEGRSIQIRPELACSEIHVKKQAGVPFQQLRYQTPSYGDSQQVATMWSLEALFLAGLASGLTVVEHKPFMRKNIDPIVYPGQYVSHMHSFYGSDALTKDLPTTAELHKGCPSGENPNDLSVYCMPSAPPIQQRPENNTAKTFENPSFEKTLRTNPPRGTNPLLRQQKHPHGNLPRHLQNLLRKHRPRRDPLPPRPRNGSRQRLCQIPNRRPGKPQHDHLVVRRQRPRRSQPA